MHCLPAVHDTTTEIGLRVRATLRPHRGRGRPTRCSPPPLPWSSSRRRTGCTPSKPCSSRRWGSDMLIVVALGGNALLERNERPDAAAQRQHARSAARALAPLAAEHTLVLCHGNGPQIGMLAVESDERPGSGPAVPAGHARRADPGHDRVLADPGTDQRGHDPSSHRDHHADRGRRGRPGVPEPHEVRRPAIPGTEGPATRGAARVDHRPRRPGLASRRRLPDHRAEWSNSPRSGTW